jgi:thiol-disulfide isomerase/thioredoxin
LAGFLTDHATTGDQAKTGALHTATPRLRVMFMTMKNLRLLLFSTVLLTTGARAQTTPTPATASVTAPAAATTDGFRISGQIRGLKDTTIVLAHYFGAGQYIPKDTARINAEGKFVFEGTKKLPEALYIVVPPNNRYIELIVGNSRFSFETDTTNLIQQMKVVGSPETELFYSFQQRLGKFYDEAQAIQATKKMRQDGVSGALSNKQLADLQKQAQDYRKTFLTENAGTFTAKLLKAAEEPDVPAPPKAANGRPDSLWTFNYYKAHYWDNFDFADERLVRTPMLQRKIDRYLKELTVQVPDSLIRSADFVVEKAKADKEVLSYTIWYITSQYEQPKVMGVDGLFVHMAEKYYYTGIMPVTDSSTVSRIREKVEQVKPTLVGQPLPALSVSDTLQRPINLAAIKANYTVFFFYDPECGHCRESAPKLKKFVDENRAKGIETVAIAVANSAENWKKYIREFKLTNMIHGYDYSFRTDYRKQFDVATTPTIFVLDNSRKIIARKLPVEQLADFIQFHQRQQVAKTDKVPGSKAQSSKVTQRK